MNKVVRYKGIIVRAGQERKPVDIPLKEAPGSWLEDLEPMDRFLAPVSLKFYGVPVLLSEEDEEALLCGVYDELEMIYEIRGTYVLLSDIIAAGLEPVLVCDDDASGLAHVASVVMEQAGNLIEQFLLSGFFYMEMEGKQNELCGLETVSRILLELPALLGYHFHLAPDILACFPAAVGEVKQEFDPKKDALLRQALRKADIIPDILAGESGNVRDARNSGDNVVEFTRDYIMSREEQAEELEKSENEPVYPAGNIDAGLFGFLRQNGFAEIEDSRVLLKALIR